MHKKGFNQMASQFTDQCVCSTRYSKLISSFNWFTDFTKCAENVVLNAWLFVFSYIKASKTNFTDFYSPWTVFCCSVAKKWRFKVGCILHKMNVKWQNQIIQALRTSSRLSNHLCGHLHSHFFSIHISGRSDRSRSGFLLLPMCKWFDGVAGPSYASYVMMLWCRWRHFIRYFALLRSASSPLDI